MAPQYDTLYSLVVWIAFMVFGGPAANAVLYVVYESEIFDPARGYIEARFPGSKLEYLINCPFCLSYWISAFVANIFAVTCFLIPLFGGNPWAVILLGLFTFLAVAGEQVQRIKNGTAKK